MARRSLLRLLPCLLCFLLLYAASVWLAASPPRHRQSLRTALVVEDRSGGLLAMHWNINTATESDRLAEIGAVIRTHAPALVGLNEVALGPAAFARQAKAWGFAHSLLLKTDRAHRFNDVALLPRRRGVALRERVQIAEQKRRPGRQQPPQRLRLAQPFCWRVRREVRHARVRCAAPCADLTFFRARLWFISMKS